MDLFKKSSYVGVSITPTVGLEVAQIDEATQTIIKYGNKPLQYDNSHYCIADLDLFKETLNDLFLELQIPKGATILLNLPTTIFKINDYRAVMDETQITYSIEEELAGHPIFKQNDPAIAFTQIPNNSVQFKKIAYSAIQKSMIIEIILMIKKMGYKIGAIDVSVNSILNALKSQHIVEIPESTNWTLLIVEDSFCRIFTMDGYNYIDSYEEKISIGEVLEDTENYNTVTNTVTPILKNIPSKFLCVVSQTNIISARLLAQKIQYSAPIIHQESNKYVTEPLTNVADDIEKDLQNRISLSIIGMTTYTNNDVISSTSLTKLNLFNKNLGDIYWDEQPPILNIFNKKYILTNMFLLKALCIILLIIIGIGFGIYIPNHQQVINNKKELASIKQEQEVINQYLKENEEVSTSLFDEGDEIRIGLTHNKKVYSYFTIIGTDIPQKLWLTHLKIGDKVSIEGNSENIDSIYYFYRSIKDYRPNPNFKIQKLGFAKSTELLANIGKNIADINKNADSILSALDADFYEFKFADFEEHNNDKTNKKNTKSETNMVPIDDIN